MSAVCLEPGCPNLRPCVVPGHEPVRRSPRSPSSRATGRRDWRPIRKRILRRDGYRCRYCGGDADQVDHVRPVSMGGTNDDGNLVAACAGCNNRRGNR